MSWTYTSRPAGACPVQATGTVKGPHGEQSWYFRARGGCWSLHVGPISGDYGYVPSETAVWWAGGADLTDGFGAWNQPEDNITPPLIAAVLQRYLHGHPGGEMGLVMGNLATSTADELYERARSLAWARWAEREMGEAIVLDETVKGIESGDWPPEEENGG